jgi:hypothetical protein
MAVQIGVPRGTVQQSGRGVRASGAAGRWLSHVPDRVQDGRRWDGETRLDSAGLNET